MILFTSQTVELWKMSLLFQYALPSVVKMVTALSNAFIAFAISLFACSLIVNIAAPPQFPYLSRP
jgi:hypothetical protein